MTVASTRPRPQRQGLTDFTLPVARADVAAIHAAQGAPDWLLADREAGFDAFEALPSERNMLYTTYIDLRGARLAETELFREPSLEPSTIELPDGSDGLLVVTDGDLTGVALSAEATAAGVELATLIWQRLRFLRQPIALLAWIRGRSGERTADPVPKQQQLGESLPWHGTSSVTSASGLSPTRQS
jgi:hypothetical protein